MSEHKTEAVGWPDPRTRYYHDPSFAALVNQMTAFIMRCEFTPSEMREAAILASIRYEEMRIDKRIINPELEMALRVVHDINNKGERE